MITLQTLTSRLLSPNDLIRLVETMQLTVRKKGQRKTYLAVSLGAKLFSGSEKCNAEMENMIT